MGLMCNRFSCFYIPTLDSSMRPSLPNNSDDKHLSEISEDLINRATVHVDWMPESFQTPLTNFSKETTPILSS